MCSVGAVCALYALAVSPALYCMWAKSPVFQAVTSNETCLSLGLQR